MPAGDEGGHRARNRAQQWVTRFNGRGFTVRPDAARWRWGLELKQVGFAGSERAVAAVAKLRAEGQRMVYERGGGVEEWFVNDERGLEHGFTIGERPEVGDGAQSADARLTFRLAVLGGLRPVVERGGAGVRFVDAKGAPIVNYAGLKVWDADGRELAARFERGDARHVTLSVDERGARYPVTIDPVAQQAYLKPSAVTAHAGDGFGSSVSVSGDTVVVGASSEDSSTTGVNSTPNENAASAGAAYVFVRSGTTWSQQAYLKPAAVGTTQAGDTFGNSVSVSGDTVVVGARLEDSSTTGVNSTPDESAGSAGAAYVFTRSGTTWSQQAYLKPAAVGTSQASDLFGTSVSVSGDTVVVGAPGEDSSTTGVNSTPDESAESAGAAYIFAGFGPPPNTAPVASATPNPATTSEDTAVQITLTGTDADGNTLTFTITDAPDNGSLNKATGTPLTADNCSSGTCTLVVAYTPSANYNGPDSFKFKVNDGTVDSEEVTVNINVNAVADISIADVSQAEGNTGTSNFTFNVTLDSAAPAGGSSVNFATSDGSATGGASCTAGVDYKTTSGTVTFAQGDTLKTITVEVCGDTTPEIGETFSVNLSSPSNATIADATGTGTIQNDDESASAGRLIISEFRLRGPGLVNNNASPASGDDSVTPNAVADTTPQANDEFIELYNPTDSSLLVTTTDGSAGFAVAASDGTARCVIANGKVIPARGHFLCANSVGYSLSGYPSGNNGSAPTTATPDATYTLDIPDNMGIALFRSAVTFDGATRLDSVGSTTETNALYKEGAGYTALSSPDIAANLDHSFYRSLCSFVGGVGCTTPGLPRDTQDNATDFLFVDTQGTATAAGQRLGAPGPENLTSPVQSQSSFSFLLLDRTKATSAPPNRVREFTSDPANNSPFGTLSIRRRVTNTTSAPVTRLRFRIIEVTTSPAPSGTADLRARTSSDSAVTGIDDTDTCASSNAGGAPCEVTVRGTILETPPAQSNGGGYNSSLSAGSVTLAAPLQPGESINVRFLLGINQTGTFRFLIAIEALNGPIPVSPNNTAPVGDSDQKKRSKKPRTFSSQPKN